MSEEEKQGPVLVEEENMNREKEENMNREKEDEFEYEFEDERQYHRVRDLCCAAMLAHLRGAEHLAHDLFCKAQVLKETIESDEFYTEASIITAETKPIVM